jgi:O-antigen/teichoic acid export membrane protein
MIGTVIGTMAARLFVMLMSIGVVMLAGHRLGAEGLGDISLLVLAITFIMLVSNVAGGSALVHLLPRHGARLLRPAYAWAILVAFVAAGIVHVVPLAPEGTEIHVVVLAFIQSIYTIHFNAMLARQRMAAINALQALQALVLLISFSLLSGGTASGLMDYVQASYIAYGFTALGSIAVMVLLRFPAPADAPPVLGRLFVQGGQVQLANFLQLLNYRLAYYLIERFQGLAALGIYSVGNQLSEGAWLGPKSVGTVLYGRVSNSTDAAANQRITLAAAKAAVLLALVVWLLIVLVPEHLFQILFGPEIVGVTRLTLLLGPGIMGMAVSQALSHYYSGIGRNIHNVMGSGIGVLCTLGFGMWLIPAHGIAGAAITASMAYCTNALYQLIVFLHTTRTPIQLLFPDRSDMEWMKRLFNRQRHQG